MRARQFSRCTINPSHHAASKKSYRAPHRDVSCYVVYVPDLGEGEEEGGLQQFGGKPLSFHRAAWYGFGFRIATRGKMTDTLAIGRSN